MSRRNRARQQQEIQLGLESLWGSDSDRLPPVIWLGPRPGGNEWNNEDMAEFLESYGWQLWTEPERLPRNYRDRPMYHAPHASLELPYTLWAAVSDELERIAD